MAATRPPGFLGRARERNALDRLLADVRAGSSGVLVLRGEAGIGKTALLRYVARQASGFRVVQVAGVEAEMELPYAGLHQLCARMLDRLDALPRPQRDALGVALGLAAGNPPDRFLFGLAVLGLLSAVAGDRPLLCLVEDAQWLDEASCQALGFVARRLAGEWVAIVVAVREPAACRDFDGLPSRRARSRNASAPAWPYARGRRACTRWGHRRRPRDRISRRRSVVLLRRRRARVRWRRPATRSPPHQSSASWGPAMFTWSGVIVVSPR